MLSSFEQWGVALVNASLQMLLHRSRHNLFTVFDTQLCCVLQLTCTRSWWSTSHPTATAVMRNTSLKRIALTDSVDTWLCLQNAVIESQETPLRLSFAKDKPSERPPPTSSLASDALQVCLCCHNLPVLALHRQSTVVL